MPFVYTAIAVLAVLLALVAFIATRPPNLRVERSAQVDAPVDVVFSIINDLHQWGRWSPWDKRDPEMKKIYAGSESGPGAIYTWNGNKNVGEGRMTILESTPGELISMKLEFLRPFPATHQVTFELAPTDTGTRVRWIMDGKRNFLMKAFHTAFSLFMNMDKMIGKDFEEGLANLNIAAQADTHARA